MIKGMSKTARLELLVEKSSMAKSLKKIGRKYLDYGYDSLSNVESDKYHHKILPRLSNKCRVCLNTLTYDELTESIISNAYCDDCELSREIAVNQKAFDRLALSNLANQIIQLKMKYGQDELWKFARGWKDCIEEFSSFTAEDLGKRLTAKSTEMKIQIKAGPHRNGTIGVYHKKVVDALVKEIEEELEGVDEGEIEEIFS